MLATVSPAVRVPASERGAAAPAAASAAQPRSDPADDFVRAVLRSVMDRQGETLSLEVASEAQALEVSTRLEVFLLTMAMGTGGASVRVAPGFMEHTYPAMRALTRSLDEAGLGGLWSGADGRTVRLLEAWQTFVSVDRPQATSRPSGGPRGRADGAAPGCPDTLLEVVSAHRISPGWYRTRVLPRAGKQGLTTAFYGVSRGEGRGEETLFDRVRRVNLTRQWRDGVQRHFGAPGGAAGRDTR